MCAVVRRPTRQRVGAVVVCVESYAVQYHQHADDLMIYLSLAPKAFGDPSSVVSCSDAVSP